MTVSILASPRPPTKKRWILVVEDDDAVRRSLQLLLASRGHEVRAYSSPEGLANDPAALRCDLLIADLIVPPTNTIALLGDLRSIGWGGQAVLVSGFLDDYWRKRAVAAGFDAVLTKPVSQTVMVQTVERLLQ